MYNILNSDEYTEVEGRKYLNPQVALDESNRFINNLRSNQAQQNQQIATDTYNLGTSVPSVMGGLGTNIPKSMSYFTSRYQTPQTNSTLANLRATAQAKALSQALQNEQAKWQKKYNDAYRKYQKSAYDKGNAANAGSAVKGDVDFESTSETSYNLDDYVPGVSGASTVANILPDWNNPENSKVSGITAVPYGEDGKTNFVYNYSPSFENATTDLSLKPTAVSGVISGNVRYTLPSGKQVTINNWNEELKRGTDGNYYVRNKGDNSYRNVGR